MGESTHYLMRGYSRRNVYFMYAYIIYSRLLDVSRAIEACTNIYSTLVVLRLPLKKAYTTHGHESRAASASYSGVSFWCDQKLRNLAHALRSKSSNMRLFVIFLI